jgi:hypothetical protein
MKDENVSEEFRSQLRRAVEESAAREADWAAFYNRLSAAVAGQLSALRRRTSGGYRATAAVGAAWWDYAASTALAAVPIGLAAALLLFAFLRSPDSRPTDAPPIASAARVAAANRDSARAAFESVLTGGEAPRAAMATLIPVPAAAFLAESAGRGSK